MRIWGSQWSHFPRHRCFRFCISFMSPSAIANSVFLRHPECTPSSANRGLDSVRISMGERHEHGRIALAWETHMRISMRESMESLSASSFSLMRRVVFVSFTPFDSSSIDVLFHRNHSESTSSCIVDRTSSIFLTQSRLIQS
jgi:hypothetical protein